MSLGAFHEYLVSTINNDKNVDACHSRNGINKIELFDVCLWHTRIFSARYSIIFGSNLTIWLTLWGKFNLNNCLFIFPRS